MTEGILKLLSDHPEAAIGFIGALLGTFVGAFVAIIGTLIPPVIEGFRTRIRIKKNAQFLAIHVICIFDEFVNKCCEVAEDEGHPNLLPSSNISFDTNLPNIKNFPENLDWRVLDHKLMYRILGLPNKIKDTFDYISNIANFNDDVTEERRYEFCLLGLDAAELAQHLRKKYNIPEKPENSRNPDWDAVEFLQRTKDRIDNLRIERIKSMPVFKNQLI